ncbi:MAG: SgcJ/EcaC family oxidoreductase [Planctomycetes bacterium]|nr:SgcJ/EcaC family oxidoreductase [Planctomycetota bacterium]
MRTRYGVGAVVVVSAAMIFTLALAQDKKNPSNADQEIRKASEAYAAAYNKGDVNAVMAHWAADAEYVDDSGKSTKGQAALTEMYKNALGEGKGVKVQIKTSAIRLIKDDLAMQEGESVLTQPSGETDSSPFSALWMKKDGKWVLQLVRDLSDQTATVAEAPNARLKELAWLVGEWSFEAKEKDIKTTIKGKWMKGEKFLILDIVVSNKGEETMSMIQVVGWDPTGQRLHSWFYDTRGGFGEGYWSRKGNKWTVEVAGVTADGRHGTGTNVWQMEDENKFIFEASDRDLDGQELPDVKVTYTRVKK